MNSLFKHILLLLLVVSFAAALVYENAPRVFFECSEVGDYAANALRVESAKKFEERLGPYSRFRFHHPGPILFYLRAFGETLLSSFELSPYASHTLTQLFLNLLFVFLGLHIAVRRTRSLISPTLMFCFLWFYFYREDSSFWIDTWGPPSIIAPMFLFVLAAADLSLGNKRPMIFLVVSATIALQTHLATAIYVFPIALIAFVFFFLRTSGRNLKSTLALNILIGFLLWFPPLVELLATKKNNLFRILSFQERHQDIHSFPEILEFLKGFYVPETVARQDLWFFGLLLLVLILPFGKNRFLSNLRIFLVLGIVMTGVSARYVYGDLYSYLAFYHHGLAPLLYSLLFIFVVESLPRHKRIAYVVTFLASIFVGYYTLQNYYLIRNALCNDKPRAQLQAINPKPRTLYVLTIAAKKDQRAWSDAVGVALLFEREGILYCVPPNWGFLYGREKTCRKVRAEKSHLFDAEQVIKFSLSGVEAQNDLT